MCIRLTGGMHFELLGLFRVGFCLGAGWGSKTAISLKALRLGCHVVVKIVVVLKSTIADEHILLPGSLLVIHVSGGGVSEPFSDRILHGYVIDFLDLYMGLHTGLHFNYLQILQYL